MPLPKRPSGGAAPQKAAPRHFDEQQKIDEEELVLPELDDFILPELDLEPDAKLEEASINPSTPKLPKVSPAVLSDQKDRPSSLKLPSSKPAHSAVADRLPITEDEDEETALDRELGLLDDEDLELSSTMSIDSDDDSEDDSESPNTDDDYEENVNSLVEIDEDEDNFADLLRHIEQTAHNSDEDLEDQGETVNDDPNEMDDWELTLSELESLSKESEESEESEETDESSDEYTLETEEDTDDEDFDLSGFLAQEDSTPSDNPPSLPYFEDEDEDDEEDSSDVDPEEDDFVPPTDPFANPFDNEKPRTRKQVKSEDSEPEESEEAAEDEESDETAQSGSLKDKVSSLLSPAKAKRGLANYFAKINAELHGEDLPKPRTEEDEVNSEPINDENFSNDSEQAPRSGAKIFGFLSPIKALYTGIVNFIFAILTTVLGILSKLPLIGFIFKIALEATKVLRAIAQYIPLAFFIGGLIAISYFSVPRESLIALPDSGGATFNNFQYDSSSNSAVGTIINTGDIIANVQPEFEVRAIKPGLNPVSWVIPEVVSKCTSASVQVDIDSTMNVTAKCSEPITGFFPRVTGVLN